MDFDYSFEIIIPDNTGNITIGGTGALVLPSGTVAQRGTPIAGMIRYNTDATPVIEGYVNGSWISLSGGTGGNVPVGGGTDKVFYENDTTVTTNYTITTNKNAMSAGPITINSGVIVTVPNGSVWTIIH